LTLNKGEKVHRDIKEDYYRRREKGTSKEINTVDGNKEQQRSLI